MPAEKSKLSRRPSRKEPVQQDVSPQAREIELKRARGEVSCAECRRLKIRCDKQIPCQSCVRRGCDSLCPNGALATGQGTRFVLAATQHLHRRLGRLGERIRALEVALEVAQTRVSKEPHPLLAEDKLLTEVNLNARDDESPSPSPAPQPRDDMIDAFGTLSISAHGVSRFFGPTGGAESLLMSAGPSTGGKPSHRKTASQAPSTPSPAPSSPPTSPSSYTASPNLFSHAFPFTPIGSSGNIYALVMTYLPPIRDALTLIDAYFDGVNGLMRATPWAQVKCDMLPRLYPDYTPPAPPLADEDHLDDDRYGKDCTGPHALALLFMVFAVGALVRGADAGGAELAVHYSQLAHAALQLRHLMETPSIFTIQALHLMSLYCSLTSQGVVGAHDESAETTMEMSWSLLTFACHLSQTIGLHRDSERWGLSAKMIRRRRHLFWHLFTMDVWQSLNTGRPPSFSRLYIDCNFPEYPPNEEDIGTLDLWHFKFASECLSEVVARMVVAEAPTYVTVMALDKKVREFALPEGVQTFKREASNKLGYGVLDHVKEAVLLFIHRSFFAQAIIEQPVNPLKSSYAPSFLAAYRASTTILKSVKELNNLAPLAVARFIGMWTNAFGAAIVLGTVVTRGPKSPLAPAAMQELEQACTLFATASVHSKRAADAWPILHKLSIQARSELAQEGQNAAPPPTSTPQPDQDDEDILAIFAGHARFVSPGTKSTYSRRGATSCAPVKFQYSPPEPSPARQGHPPAPAQSLSALMLDDRELDSLLSRAFQQQQQQLQGSIMPGDFDSFRPARLGWDTRTGQPAAPPSYAPPGASHFDPAFHMPQQVAYHGTDGLYSMPSGVGYGAPLGQRNSMPARGVPPSDAMLDPQWASFMMNR
ncbi:fungal-specific transcription factor domain-containing protein [Schizophyllum amplum]|uniref:Fungal-specific transcription factor domain-containing protein n=1 Tax=Schizophyllum amplum TaxID=97359 RepID=A0A550CTB9_9AGAR|nr:fungal-specific transcription factor domain-containing protein [Auriculariopsis ampla]